MTSFGWFLLGIVATLLCQMGLMLWVEYGEAKRQK